MQNPNARHQNINIDIIVRSNCNFSLRIVNELSHLLASFPDIPLNIINVEHADQNRQSFGGITPSIWVNDNLWFLGSFNPERFQNKLKALKQDGYQPFCNTLKKGM